MGKVSYRVMGEVNKGMVGVSGRKKRHFDKTPKRRDPAELLHPLKTLYVLCSIDSKYGSSLHIGFQKDRTGRTAG
jgi:hypothetical protein